MTLTLPIFNFFNLKRRFCPAIAKPAAAVIPKAESATTDRAFLRDLMVNTPEGIQSEFGVMAMMTQYLRHF